MTQPLAAVWDFKQIIIGKECFDNPQQITCDKSLTLFINCFDGFNLKNAEFCLASVCAYVCEGSERVTVLWTNNAYKRQGTRFLLTDEGHNLYHVQ